MCYIEYYTVIEKKKKNPDDLELHELVLINLKSISKKNQFERHMHITICKVKKYVKMPYI